MTDVFVDCEFDADGLISMALVSRDSWFYEVLRDTSDDEWVSENVIPVLARSPISSAEFRSRLNRFLRGFQSLRLWADWPQDVGFFMAAIAKAPNMLLFDGPITAVVDRGLIDSRPDRPHNALSDARANMQTFNARMGNNVLDKTEVSNEA